MRERARRTWAILLLLAPFGCALLRSAPRPPEEWTLISFPGEPLPSPSRDSLWNSWPALAIGCAGPDTITFALELRCDAGNRYFDRHALIVSNWTPSGYRPDVLRAIMSQADGRKRFASQAAALASDGGYEGMLLDLRLLGPRDVDPFVRLVTAIADSARSSGISPVGIVVPIADTAAYPGRHLGAVTDFLAASLELDPATAGPLTPRDRMSGLVGARAAEIGAHRVMLLLPADGYLWAAGAARRRISFEEAVATARDWGVELTRDETSATLRARAPGRGEIWVNDATLISGIVRDARRLGIRKFALYGLGGEDPGIWSAIASRAITR
ncbi:MAG TPA: hypothetical protein VMY38_03965 [Gemmatimonadaceae bacterium]|nr:hypothetical protein [Gemmatimonadaceae bacterium]